MLRKSYARIQLLLIVPVALCLLLLPNQASAQACTEGACLSIGPDLGDVDGVETEFVDALLSSLLGVDLDIDELDVDALATGEIDLAALLEQLRIDGNFVGTEDGLTAELTLNQLLVAAGDVAQANGDVALRAALDDLSASIIDVDGSDTLRLADLLEGDLLLSGSTSVQLNALDLVTALIQLNNFENIQTPSFSATLSGGSLGLRGILDEAGLGDAEVGDAELTAQVTSPPVFTCGGVGSQFQSAGLRLALDIDLLDFDLDQADLINIREALDALGIVGLTDVEVATELSQLRLFVDVAPTTGTISAIDATSGDVTAQVTPGAVSVSLGNLDDTVFFNREELLDLNVDLEADTVGTLGITLTTPLLDTPLNFDISAQATGSVAAGEPQTVVFSGGLPATQTTMAGSTFIEDLAANLVADLEVELDGDLDLLDGLIDLDALETLLAPVLEANLPTESLLSGLLDPILDGAGIGLGEANITVSAPLQRCTDLAVMLSSSGDFESGATGTFFIDIDNLGDSVATEPITVELMLPAELSFVSFAGEGWTVSSTDGTLAFSTDSNVAAGASLPQLSVTVRVDGQAAGSTVTTEAVLTANDDAAPDNNFVSTATQIILNLNGDDDDDGLPNGGENADPNGDGDPDDAQDTDGDGTSDFLDGDDDGDGVLTREENADPNGDGNPDDAQDTDGDGTPDFLDGDDDGDGVLTREENADPNGDGNPGDAQDTDGNGTPDYLDPDDDGDSAPTNQENADPNGDGIPNDARDTDGDSLPDYLDPDDDGDSVPTITEEPDPNGDGNIDDAQDTDGDGTPDFRDEDDDNDGTPTLEEASKGTGNPLTDDEDGDGIPNFRDDADDRGESDNADDEFDILLPLIMSEG